MIPENTIIIPKTEHRITGDYRADRLIEYVRKNNFPNWETQPILFVYEDNYALCSELNTNMYKCTLKAVELGLHDEGSKYKEEGELFVRFEGGWLIQQRQVWEVYVDGHLYLFDF